MCYGSHQLPSKDDLIPPSRPPRPPPVNENALEVVDLRSRLAETEARLQRARAREAQLTCQLQEMKRFVSVMEILENYLKRRFLEQQQQQLSLLMLPGLTSEQLAQHMKLS